MAESERKRCRESQQCEHDGEEEQLPAFKRQQRGDLQVEVLAPDVPQVEDDEEQLLDESHVSYVMRSLEEELVGISSSSSSSTDQDEDEEQLLTTAAAPTAAAAGACSSPSSTSSQRLDLGYLLEASDDELGIEPAALEEEEHDQQQAVVEADDLVRGESWSQADWSVDALFAEEQEWLCLQLGARARARHHATPHTLTRNKNTAAVPPEQQATHTASPCTTFARSVLD